jgi:cysteine synthase A
MSDYGIGNTPLLELPSLNGNRVFLKMESKNYLGSVKARTGYALVNGLDCPFDRVIIESTSGNLGLALDFFCKEVRRPFLCLLDDTVVPAKLRYLKSKGIECEIVKTEEGLDGRSSRMKRAAALTAAGTHFWVNQYDNEDGVNVHKETTAVEIYNQTSGSVSSVFCAVGSGGTISGIGEYFRSIGASVRMVGVEPFGSTIFHSDDAPYITAGAGLRGKPGNILRHSGIVEVTYAIHDKNSIEKCKLLNEIYGVDVGITTGMIYAATEKYCITAQNEIIVLLAADGVELYHEYL